jgi:hypothetical protein
LEHGERNPDRDGRFAGGAARQGASSAWWPAGPGRILNRIGERAQAPATWRGRSARRSYGLALPFARPVRDELVHALARLRARLS